MLSVLNLEALWAFGDLPRFQLVARVRTKELGPDFTECKRTSQYPETTDSSDISHMISFKYVVEQLFISSFLRYRKLLH